MRFRLRPRFAPRIVIMLRCSVLALIVGGCLRTPARSQAPALPAVSDAPAVAAPEAEADQDEDNPEHALEGDAGTADDTESEAPDPESIDDEGEASDEPLADGPRAPHPLDGVSPAEILRRLRNDPRSLGTMSVGRPNGGLLLNGERLPEDPRWTLVDSSHAFGTAETNQYLASAIGKVFRDFPDSPPVFIGHVSGPNGGPLRPHRSHQSGQDVDVGFFYLTDHRWYQRATQNNLDRKRTWALVRALVTETDVRMIFLDVGVQRILRDYALSAGEDPNWLSSLFDSKARGGALIRHAPGHATHLHVRFYNPIAEETARRCYAGLVQLNRIPQPAYTIDYVAKKGDSLISISKRFGVSVKELRRLNGMRGKVIYAKRSYKIPRRGPAPMPPAIRVPQRRLPPDLARPTSPVPEANHGEAPNAVHHG